MGGRIVEFAWLSQFLFVHDGAEKSFSTPRARVGGEFRLEEGLGAVGGVGRGRGLDSEPVGNRPLLVSRSSFGFEGVLGGFVHPFYASPSKITETTLLRGAENQVDKKRVFVLSPVSG